MKDVASRLVPPYSEPLTNKLDVNWLVAMDTSIIQDN
jgi:hypothetical protein